jgi:hypothetical protein
MIGTTLFPYRVSLKQHVRTFSTTFLLPMVVGMLGEDYRRLGFYNIYLGDENIEQHPEALYVLFQTRLTKRYYDYERKLCLHPGHLGHYDVIPGFIMHVFEVPTEYLEDYHAYINGEYTKLSKEYKLNFKQGSRVCDVVQGHLNYPKWNPELEIFKLKLITNSNNGNKKN